MEGGYMAQTSFLLSDELLAEIDAEAERRHLSRADVMREKLYAAYATDVTFITPQPQPTQPITQE
jgi:hypothetical protein